MIKTLAVKLPLTDTKKMEQFKEKTGVDIARQIRAQKEMEEEERAAAANADNQARTRRVQPAVAEPAPTTGRRTTGSKYKVVNKPE